MASAVEISCDLGEAGDAVGRAVEAALWPLVDAANVACGGHAGDRESMAEAVRRAGELGVVLGAHPSYPDREGFGRRRIGIAPEALREALVGQIALLRRLATEGGVRLDRVKPHGALYNEAHHDADLAEMVVAAAGDVDRDLALVAAPGSMLLERARAAGLRVVREAFADRRYAADGSLVPRGRAGALLLDPVEAAAQALGLARDGGVVTEEGTPLAIAFDTLCVHGDMEGAVERLQAIRRALGRGEASSR
ncbi:MAG: 5-oxoprolinase subunit PxpA [Thermoanaerobaculia bacterium]